MADNKSLKGEQYKKKFTAVYTDALDKVSKMNKKIQLCYDIKNELNEGQFSGVDEEVKQEVWFEMSARFALEKHKIMDKLFGELSNVLETNGKIDHRLSMEFKNLMYLNALAQSARGGGAGGVDAGSEDIPEEAYVMAWKPILDGVKSGQLDRDEAFQALNMVASQFGIVNEDKRNFFKGFVKFAGSQGVNLDAYAPAEPSEDEENEKEESTGESLDDFDSLPDDDDADDEEEA